MNYNTTKLPIRYAFHSSQKKSISSPTQPHDKRGVDQHINEQQKVDVDHKL